MQGIYIPETNYVPREYSVAAVLLLLFMVLISFFSVLNLLYFYISTFRSMCAVPSMAVFCISLTLWFPGMLLTYFLNVFEIVSVARIITGITLFLHYYYYYYYYYCLYIFREVLENEHFELVLLSPFIFLTTHGHFPIPFDAV